MVDAFGAKRQRIDHGYSSHQAQEGSVNSFFLTDLISSMIIGCFRFPVSFLLQYF
jgi:hypothetical protein